MKKEFFIHGTPSDLESTSKNVFDGLEERIADGFFKPATRPADSTCMVCEIRPWRNNYYSVYTYYRIGIDRNGELLPSCYCALTLVVEGMVGYDTGHIYDLMSLAYETGLQQTLNYIDKSGRYLINTFRGREKLDYLANDIYQRLDESTFKQIDANGLSIGNTNSIVRYNIQDTDSKAFHKALRQYGKVYVSTDYPSHEQKINDLERRLGTLESLQGQYRNLQTENRRLNEQITELLKREEEREKPIVGGKKNDSTIKELQNQIASLEQANQYLRERLAKAEQGQGSIQQGQPKTNQNSSTQPQGSLIDQFKRAIKGSKPSDWFPPLNCLLLILCLFCIHRKFIPTTIPFTDSDSTSVAESKESNTYENFFIQLRNTNEFLKQRAIVQMFEKSRSLRSQNIDIIDGSSAINKDQECRLGLADSTLIEAFNPELGRWQVKGACEMTGENSIKGREKGSATIFYEYDGIKVLSRTITVK